ncbi:MAG: hypothetical protein ACRDF4_09815, partial [Rhabdochlamydiaceae bacterium]
LIQSLLQHKYPVDILVDIKVDLDNRINAPITDPVVVIQAVDNALPIHLEQAHLEQARTKRDLDNRINAPITDPVVVIQAVDNALPIHLEQAETKMETEVDLVPLTNPEQVDIPTDIKAHHVQEAPQVGHQDLILPAVEVDLEDLLVVHALD